MSLNRLPPIALAIVLQILPISRIVCVSDTGVRASFAILMKWCAGAGVLLGGLDAMSGASAAVAGVANVLVPGPVTLTATGAVGQAFEYRIVVTNPGVNPAQAYYDAAPLPPGLTINTAVGGDGHIKGTPTTAGTWSPVTLTAGNLNYPTTVSTNITIIIAGPSPPHITSLPTNTTVRAGTNALFKVTATGTAPLRYRWQFAGTNITWGTTNTLSLTNVQPSDAGIYTVTITNSAGTTNASATLTVTTSVVPPTITSPPQNLTVDSGQTASFSVAATGTALSYQWQFGGTNIPWGTSETLSLTNVQPSDAGTYMVTVANSAGTNTASALLTVNIPVIPPTITAPPQDVTVTSGQTASFTVAATGTALSYQWQFGGTNIPWGTSETLSLTNVQPSDAGTYMVTVANSAGTNTASALLTVNLPVIPPTITTPPQDVTVTSGQTASFSVVATGTALSYQWQFGGTNIPWGISDTLLLTNVQTSDSGTYMVTVANSAGTNTASALLTVNLPVIPPTITSPPQSLTVSNGETASFSVTASGTAPLSYQWQWYGTNLPAATLATLVLTNVQLANSGDYAVVVSNAAGTNTSAAAHLTVLGPVTPLVLANPQWTNGLLIFDITGPSQTNYVVWSCTNLMVSVWSALQTNFVADGLLRFTCSNCPPNGAYYRATIGP
jgi:hypothetical protein